MRINMNSDEYYEIKMPEEIDVKEFIELLDKLSKVVKLINLSKLGNFDKFKTQFNQRAEKKVGTYNTRRVGKITWFDTREKVLDLLQYGYHGTKKDKKRITKLMDKTWNEISKRFHNLRLRYDIQPNEVGLTRWKSPYEKEDTKIPNWVIKSYTGLFDDEEN